MSDEKDLDEIHRDFYSAMERWREVNGVDVFVDHEYKNGAEKRFFVLYVLEHYPRESSGYQLVIADESNAPFIAEYEAGVRANREEVVDP